MDSFEFNKIAGAVLAALLVIFGTKEVMHLVGSSGGHDTAHATVGFELPAPEAAAPAAATAAAPAADAFDAKAVVALVAKGDPAAGKKTFKKCKACHTIEKGGANKVGPNLWNVIGRKKGSVSGFKYSPAMLEKGGNWSYEDFVTFVHKPKKFVLKTKMSFAGIKDSAELANLAAYIRSNADTPVPLPQ